MSSSHGGAHPQRPRINKILAAAEAAYDPKLALAICELVAEGVTLSDIVRRKGMPSRSTLERWRINYPDFGKAFEVAREASAQALEEEALNMARVLKEPNDFTGTKVRAYEVAMGQLRWSASRRDPGRFGQKTTVTNLVPVQINTTLNLGQLGPATTDQDTTYRLEAKVPTPAEDAEAEPIDTDAQAVDNPYEVPEVLGEPTLKGLAPQPPLGQRAKARKHKTPEQIKATMLNWARRDMNKRKKEEEDDDAE